MLAELLPEQLRATCGPAGVAAESVGERAAAARIIGQPRATASLDFGMGMEGRGYHIVVTGPSGVGKMTALRGYLDAEAHALRPAEDLCYVQNFRDSEHPRTLTLPAGRGQVFAGDLARLVDTVRERLPRAFEGEDYTQHVDALQKAFEMEREDRLATINSHARAAGFALQATPMGIAIVPVVNGQPMGDEQFEALSPADRAVLQQKRDAIDAEMGAMFKALRKRDRAVREQLELVEREVALQAVGGLVADLAERYADLPDVAAHLAAVQEDLIAHVALFRALAAGAVGTDQPAPLIDPTQMRERALRRYAVNVVVDRTGIVGAPVEFVAFPTYQNLIGRIEKEPQFGTLITDFTMIRAGALHRANGGYLVVEVRDLLAQPFAWDALKRALRTEQIAIEDPADWLNASSVRTLRPAPVPLHVKVVLVGERGLLDLLFAADPDCAELFRVRADFDASIPRTGANERDLVQFVTDVVRESGLRPFDPSALAKVIEHASRLAEDQTRLSVQLGPLGDLVRQADYWAGRAGATTVLAAHVRQALDQIVYRSALVEERLRELMQRGTLMVDTSGTVVGQINGLAVEVVGERAFGLPIRITASVGAGREGVIDVERAAQLGGPTHSKGVLILSGFLTEHFARNRPLSVAARLTVEQSYGEIEGDSASSAELYALLSSLAGAPIAQHLAVTGSVNQKGQVQAIGGVNEKVEGFFALCVARGLTGDQGVLIPAANVPNLMLREEIVEAVQAGKFHVYPITTVAEGIEMLTGVPAGASGADGEYPPETIFGRVAARLWAMTQALADLNAGIPAVAVNGKPRDPLMHSR